VKRGEAKRRRFPVDGRFEALARGIRRRQRPDGDIAERQARHDRDAFFLDLVRPALGDDPRRRGEAEQLGEFAELIGASVGADDLLAEVDVRVPFGMTVAFTDRASHPRTIVNHRLVATRRRRCSLRPDTVRR